MDLITPRFPFEEMTKALGLRPYMNPEEYPVFWTVAQLVQGPILEVGTGNGFSALVFLTATDKRHGGADNRVYTVDHYQGDTHSDFKPTIEATEQAIEKGILRLGLNMTAIPTRFGLYAGESATVAQQWKRKVDVLYIDGDHTYEGCKLDVMAWLPHLKVGGYLLLHDSRRNPDAPDPDRFDRGWQGPTQVAQELRRAHGVNPVHEAYSLTVWVKTRREPYVWGFEHDAP